MVTATSDPRSLLESWSDHLADAVERAGTAVVRVEGRQRQPASGIAYESGGMVLTANHVLERDDDITVGMPDGGSSRAGLVGRDPATDLALLRLETAAALTPLARGGVPRPGHVVLAVARPGMLATSMGVVSAIEPHVRTGRGYLGSVLHTDAAFYPGFSGGALVDSDGCLFGMLTTGLGMRQGVAIPRETVDRVAAVLRDHGRVARGYLGATSQPVRLPVVLRGPGAETQEDALLIVGVDGASPAERAGLMVGDLLVALDGLPTASAEHLADALGPASVGRTKIAQVIRGGRMVEVTVTIGERSA